MNLRTKNLNLLVAFDVLLQECNVTKAAKRLHITQSAASKHLNQLRKMFDDPLLVRTPKGLMPTEVALTHQSQVKRVIQAADELFDRQSTFLPSTIDKEIHLGMPDGIANFLVPDLLVALKIAAPLLRLHIHSNNSGNLKNLLENNQLDLVITYGFNLPTTCKTRCLFKDNPVVLARKNHPILKHKSVTIKHVLQYQHVVLVYEENERLSGDVFLEAHGYQKREIVVTTRNAMLCLPIVAKSNLLFTINERFAMTYAKTFDLDYRLLPKPIPKTPIHLVWTPLVDHNPWHTWLRSFIVDFFR